MQNLPISSGFIDLIVGCMFSGKTEELIRRVSVLRRGRKKVLVFKPRFDTRFKNTVIFSHSGAKVEAIPVNCKEDVEAVLRLHQFKINVLAFDEAQFLTPDFCEYFEEKANQGYQIICACLDKGYNDEQFVTVMRLLSMAEFVTKLVAVCAVCGNLATKTQRVDQNQQPVAPKDVENVIGGTDVYQARCRKCYKHFSEETIK